MGEFPGWTALPIALETISREETGVNMTKEMVWGIARAVLAAGSGYLVGMGLIDQAMATEIIGAIGVIFTAVWSVWSKK